MPWSRLVWWSLLNDRLLLPPFRNVAGRRWVLHRRSRVRRVLSRSVRWEAQVMCNVIRFPEEARRYPLALIDALDVAQSQLDEAEQLFCAGEDDAGMRCIDEAVRVLEAVK